MSAGNALAARLRSETAALHVRVEQEVGLPDSVHSRADYAALLGRLLVFHRSFENSSSQSEWSEEWATVGITLPDHERSGLLVDDLSGLGERASPEAAVLPEPTSFAQALGGLYVMEGSSLGGRALAPAFRATLGDIPTRFYDSDGRNHPHPWRSVKAALTRFDDLAGDTDDVVSGAAAMFASFGNYLASSRWQEV